MIPTLQLGQMGRFLSPMPGYTGWTFANLATPPSVWLNYGTAITVVSGHASQWNDKSGNAYNFTQTTAANRPTANIPDSTLTNTNTVTGDGSDDVMVNASAGIKAVFQNATNAWYACIAKKIGTATGIRYMALWTTNSSANARFGITSSVVGVDKMGIRIRRADADAVAQLNATTANDNNWHMWLFTVDLATRTGKVYRDGVLDSSNTTLTTVGTNFSNTATASVACFADGGAGSPSNIAIAEWAAGNGALSATEIDKAFGYMAWGPPGGATLTALLSATHPYKYAPP